MEKIDTTEWKTKLEKKVSSTLKLTDFHKHFSTILKFYGPQISAISYWAYYVRKNCRQNELNPFLFQLLTESDNLDDPTTFNKSYPLIIIKLQQFGLVVDSVPIISSTFNAIDSLILLYFVYQFFNIEYHSDIKDFFEYLEGILGVRNVAGKGKKGRLVALLENIEICNTE